MTSIVQQTTVGLGVSKGQHRTVFRNPRGQKYYYSFYIALIMTVLQVAYESSGNGITWATSPTSALTWTSVSDVWHAFDIKIHDDGSQLEVWVVGIGYDATAGAYKTVYRYGTISDGASTISWSAVQTIDAAINDEGMGQPHCIALARTDNGRIVVAFTEDYNTMGKNYRLTKLIGSDGDSAAPSWSGETTWDNPSGNTNNNGKGEVWFGLESYDSSYPDRFFLFARTPNGFSSTVYRVRTAVPDWNGSVFSNTTGTVWDSYGVKNGWVIAGVIDAFDKAHIVYERDDATNLLYYRRAATAGDDDMGSAITVDSHFDNYGALTITVDTGGANSIYVFYKLESDTVDFYYRSMSVGGSSFSDEETVSYHQNVIALSSWNRQIENSLHIAGLYGTTVIYNEHPVYKVPSTTLADMEFPDQNYYLGPHSV